MCIVTKTDKGLCGFELYFRIISIFYYCRSLRKSPQIFCLKGACHCNPKWIKILKRSPGYASYSERRLFTGLAMAALIACELMVNNANTTATIPAMANGHTSTLIR